MIPVPSGYSLPWSLDKRVTLKVDPPVLRTFPLSEFNSSKWNLKGLAGDLKIIPELKRNDGWGAAYFQTKAQSNGIVIPINLRSHSPPHSLHPCCQTIDLPAVPKSGLNPSPNDFFLPPIPAFLLSQEMRRKGVVVIQGWRTADDVCVHGNGNRHEKQAFPAEGSPSFRSGAIALARGVEVERFACGSRLI
ncbi:hypothetical protein CDAR_451111 [Caerostris darwini]|uniref:Uncharacterized protein n=1 Tax=Caerostris darwini TaxID=1538125 RepID=A0AAV4PR33_9ARAC|nr:hypothetical protein CDAR_451111 [Caerostris darwini]